LPPLLLFREPEDREVQVGRTFGRVAGSADVAEHLPALNVIALLEPVSVALEIGVEITYLVVGSNW
jgi:hypothetical protein